MNLIASAKQLLLVKVPTLMVIVLTLFIVLNAPTSAKEVISIASDKVAAAIYNEKYDCWHQTKALIVFHNDVIVMPTAGRVNYAIAIGSLIPGAKPDIITLLADKGHLCTLAEGPDGQIWTLLYKDGKYNLVELSRGKSKSIVVPSFDTDRPLYLVVTNQGPILLYPKRIASYSDTKWHSVPWNCPKGLLASVHDDWITILPYLGKLLIYYPENPLTNIPRNAMETTNWVVQSVDPKIGNIAEAPIPALVKTCCLDKNGKTVWCTGNGGQPLGYLSDQKFKLVQLPDWSCVRNMTCDPSGSLVGLAATDREHLFDVVKLSTTKIPAQYIDYPASATRSLHVECSEIAKFQTLFELPAKLPYSESIRVLSDGKIIFGLMFSQKDRAVSYREDGPNAPNPVHAAFLLATPNKPGEWKFKVIECPFVDSFLKN